MIDLESRKKVMEIARSRELVAHLQGIQRAVSSKKDTDYSNQFKNLGDVNEAGVMSLQMLIPLLSETVNLLTAMVLAFPSKEEWVEIRDSLKAIEKNTAKIKK